MTREQEINIVIKHLNEEVKRVAAQYPPLLSDTIVTCGKEIEKYQEELSNLEAKLK